MSDELNEEQQMTEEERRAKLEDIERAIDYSYATGRADRSEITRAAQEEIASALEMAGTAMEADEEADEAHRITVIAEQSGDRSRARAARKRERAIRKESRKSHRAATKSAKHAYQAIKFSAPHKMGFMRFVQVSFALHIVFTLIFLMLTSRDAMTYNVTTIMDWIMVVLEGVAFWMFINRYKIARPFVMGMALFGLAGPAAYNIATHQFSASDLIANGIFFIFLFLYFAFSDRVKVVLANDFSQHKGEYEEENFVIERKGWPFYRNLIMYFIIFSVLGHWMEMGMCQFIIMGLVEGEYDPTNTMLWRDWLYPFPMEGAAVVIIALALYPIFATMREKFKNKILPYVTSFFLNALTCSLIEFSMGLLVNANYELWDYRDNFGNIMGQVCLQNALAFGVAASIITWFVYPMLERWIARVPRDIMNIVFVAVVAAGATIWSLYIIDPPTEIPTYSAQSDSQTQADRQNVIDTIDVNKLTAGLTREQIEASEALTDEEKAELLAQLDAIDQSIQSMEDVLDDAA